MIIKIYQINHERDANRLMFMSWDWWTQHGFTAPDKELYDLVYEYESDTDNLERIFRIFNHDHPEDYTARSVSVSDVVETPNGLFFCDRVGWQPVKWKQTGSKLLWIRPEDGELAELTANDRRCFATEEEAMSKPKVSFDRRGPSGNIYFILGMAQTAMKEQRRYTDFNTMRDRVFESKSYEEALKIIGEYVELIDVTKVAVES